MYNFFVLQVSEKGHNQNNGLLNGIASSISRLAANNCDLTITTTSTSSGSASPPQAHSFSSGNNSSSSSNNNNSTNVNNNNRHSPLQLQLKGGGTGGGSGGGGGGGSQHSGSSTGALSPVSDLLDDNPSKTCLKFPSLIIIFEFLLHTFGFSFRPTNNQPNQHKHG